MRITIEADLPSELNMQKEVLQHVTAYVIGYKVGNIILPGGHQPVFGELKAFGASIEAVRTGMGEMSDMVLLQLLKKCVPPS